LRTLSLTDARHGLITLLLAIVALSGVPRASGSAGEISRVAYSKAVTQVCAGALLFEGRHALGTRAGALAVAQDIRSSTGRRLRRLDGLEAPRGLERLVNRWMTLERRLANVYANSWVGIFDLIAVTHTPTQRAQAPRLLRRLLHAPDQLRLAAATLELTLHVPDCTGGTAASSDPQALSTAMTS
jgi:hypothetical protein